jgi:hypothetical protein
LVCSANVGGRKSHSPVWLHGHRFESCTNTLRLQHCGFFTHCVCVTQMFCFRLSLCYSQVSLYHSLHQRLKHCNSVSSICFKPCTSLSNIPHQCIFQPSSNPVPSCVEPCTYLSTISFQSCTVHAFSNLLPTLYLCVKNPAPMYPPSPPKPSTVFYLVQNLHQHVIHLLKLLMLEFFAVFGTTRIARHNGALHRNPAELHCSVLLCGTVDGRPYCYNKGCTGQARRR